MRKMPLLIIILEIIFESVLVPLLSYRVIRNFKIRENLIMKHRFSFALVKFRTWSLES